MSSRTSGEIGKPAEARHRWHPALHASVLENFWVTMAGTIAVVAGLVGIFILAARNYGGPERIHIETFNQSDKLKKILTIEEYEEHCQKPSAWRMDDCIESLDVFQYSLVWIDTRMLLRDGEELSPEHLDRLHGFSDQEAEAGRLAVGSLLASWCRQDGLPAPQDFEELKQRGCTAYLPTLAEMGLERDSSWDGVFSIESDYDGKSQEVFVPRRSEGERR